MVKLNLFQQNIVSEQAPPKKVKKEKPDAIPLPDQEIEKIKKVEKDKQNPKIEDNKAKQVSEFEKKQVNLQQELELVEGLKKKT